MFIELSTKGLGKFIGNVTQIKQVYINQYGTTCVVGLYDHEIEIEETYEEVIKKITAIGVNVNTDVEC